MITIKNQLTHTIESPSDTFFNALLNHCIDSDSVAEWHDSSHDSVDA
jgi:hypothetical protein